MSFEILKNIFTFVVGDKINAYNLTYIYEKDDMFSLFESANKNIEAIILSTPSKESLDLEFVNFEKKSLGTNTTLVPRNEVPLCKNKDTSSYFNPTNPQFSFIKEHMIETEEDEDKKIKKMNRFNVNLNEESENKSAVKSNDESAVKSNDESDDESAVKSNDESDDESAVKSNDESDDESAELNNNINCNKIDVPVNEEDKQKLNNLFDKLDTITKSIIDVLSPFFTKYLFGPDEQIKKTLLEGFLVCYANRISAELSYEVSPWIKSIVKMRNKKRETRKRRDLDQEHMYVPPPQPFNYAR
jgi:hypothetical protein